MKWQKITILILGIILFNACVPYKNIVYVQGDLPDDSLQTTGYKIQKDDILYVKIKSGNETVNRMFNVQSNANINRANAASLYFDGYTVDKNGNIDLPVIHKINVAGKTYGEVEELIKKQLLLHQFKVVNDIYIKVKLAGIPYTIIGEVKQPKTGILYKEKPTVFDVLGDAGDIQLVGNRKKVVIIRKENNIQIKKTLDLTDSGIVTSPYYFIRPNDIVYVPPLRQKTWGTGATMQQTISSAITALSLITTIILLSR
jgi:polysaccharide export outer membrane protein